jgi:hypothetical protein
LENHTTQSAARQRESSRPIIGLRRPVALPDEIFVHINQLVAKFSRNFLGCGDLHIVSDWTDVKPNHREGTQTQLNKK